MELYHQAQRTGNLLSFLRRELELSSSLVKRLKWQNAFFVDGQSVHTDHPVFPGSIITVILDEAPPVYPPEDGPLDILYEDDALLAVDKPAGILMHPSFYRDTGTLANLLAGYYKKTGQPCAVHPVSRLDRDTFGVVLVAKNAHIHAKMMEQLQTRQVHKTYEALVWGHPPDRGVWDFPIARRGGESLLREVREDGQAAQTRYQVMEVLDGYCRLQLQPITGRTHQLRVHCNYAGFPILGDPQYGSEESQAFSKELGLTHQQLCAVRLEFPHPVRGEPMTIDSHQVVFAP